MNFCKREFTTEAKIGKTVTIITTMVSKQSICMKPRHTNHFWPPQSSPTLTTHNWLPNQKAMFWIESIRCKGGKSLQGYTIHLDQCLSFSRKFFKHMNICLKLKCGKQSESNRNIYDFYPSTRKTIKQQCTC